MTPHEQGTDMACHLCGCPDFGSYEGQVAIVAPDWLKERWPNGIGIDVCLALEIQRLWKCGVRTTGHCCGHGRSIGYISVDEDSIKTMKSLGYTVRKNDCDPGRDDCFIPKSLGTSMTADINRIIEQIEKADTMAAYLPATSQWNVTALIKAYREMEARLCGSLGAAQITMGRGLVDVTQIDHEGRSGILFRPRDQYIPVGEPGELHAGEYWPATGDVVIWIESAGGAEVIQTYLTPFLPLQPNVEAIRITDAVLSWLVKHDLADSNTEYRAEDIMDIMDDLAPSEQEKDPVRAAAEGIADDYMTSDNHHPGYVLIQTAKFEAIRAAIATKEPTHD